IKRSLLKATPVLFFFLIFYSSCNSSIRQAANETAEVDSLSRLDSIKKAEEEAILKNPFVDSNLYRKQDLALANGDTTGKWPVKNEPITLACAIFPDKRIIAYYGNLYSKRMSILEEHAPDLMLEQLDAEIKRWIEADITTEAIPALHYLAVVAQR